MGYLNTLIKTGSSQLGSLYQFTDTPYMDPSDKLNWQVTVNVLIVLVFILINIRQFLNKMISCAVPIYFSNNQEEYANLMCYVTENKYSANESNTILIAPNQTLVYFRKPSRTAVSNQLPLDDQMPVQLGSYYIWVPYILIALILLFLLVKCLWIYLLSYQFRDLDINELLKAAGRAKNIPIDKFIYFNSAQQISVNSLLFRNKDIKWYLFNH